MELTVRDMADGDIEWATAFLLAWDPSLPAETWRRILTGEAAPMLRAIVAEAAGERIALGGVNAPEGLAYPLINVVVDERHRGRGVGSRLFAELLPLVDGADAGAGLPDHDEPSLAIARHWGFEVLGHGIDSVLALTGPVPPPALPDGVEALVLPGADVVASGVDVDGFLEQVGDFPEAEIYGSRLTNEVLLHMAPDLVWVLLVDADGVLAGSSLMPTEDGPWYIGFTGAMPRARGRGLARAAKQLTHGYAYAAGAPAVRTTNEERNERMRALNAAMGYVKVSGDLRLIRKVNGR